MLLSAAIGQDMANPLDRARLEKVALVEVLSPAAIIIAL